MVFESVKLGKKKTLNYDRFQEAARKICVARECTYQELIQIARGEQPASETVQLKDLVPPDLTVIGRKMTFSIQVVAKSFSLKELQSGCPEGVDANEKPSALNDMEFESVFGMTKESYNSLAGWKQSNLKKTHGLLSDEATKVTAP